VSRAALIGDFPGRLSPVLVGCVVAVLVAACAARGDTAPSEGVATPTKASPSSTVSAPSSSEAGREPGSDRLRVALYGDSLAVEAQAFFAQAVTSGDHAEVLLRTLGGTAICDFLKTMRADLSEEPPDVVVMEFSGNALTDCVNPGHRDDVDYYRRYHADADAVMELYEPLGIPVYWVSAPISRSIAREGDSRWESLNRMYSELSDHHDGAVYVDAGEALTRGGEYAALLPCVDGEPCAGIRDPVSGRPANRIRNPDGTHFCPVVTNTGRVGSRDCPVWSSGAWRFGLAMAEPLIRDFQLDRPART